MQVGATAHPAAASAGGVAELPVHVPGNRGHQQAGDSAHPMLVAVAVATNSLYSTGELVEQFPDYC